MGQIKILDLHLKYVSPIFLKFLQNLSKQDYNAHLPYLYKTIIQILFCFYKFTDHFN